MGRLETYLDDENVCSDATLAKLHARSKAREHGREYCIVELHGLRDGQFVRHYRVEQYHGQDRVIYRVGK